MATNVCLVLDRSGSMQAIRDDALGGVNCYIMAAKQDRALYESKFSLITFGSESVDTIRKNEIMEQVKPIAGDEYRCAGWTPLYDAIGRGIGILDEASGASAIPDCAVRGPRTGLALRPALLTGFAPSARLEGWPGRSLGGRIDERRQR
jgi:hypothetical protein